MPTVLEWSPTASPDDIVRQVRGSLEEGRAVILPSRAGYVVLVNPRESSAVDTIARLSDLGLSLPALLAFGREEPVSYGFAVPRAAVRLMERTWPGPITIALPVSATVDLPPEWSESVRTALNVEGCLRLRSPDHAVFDALMQDLRLPALVVDSYRLNPDTLAEALGETVGFVVNAGELQSSFRPTVVRVDERGPSVLEDGIVSQEDLEKLTARLVLFVCTGNTCRSPMAEVLAKQLLSERLKCTVDELPGRGYWIMSAGVAAYGGDGASSRAVEVVAEWGADLSGHESRPVNPQILGAADDVIAMTRSHAAALAMRYPGFGPPAQLLCGDDDLVDPIGGDADVYRECAQTIHSHLERLVTEWLAS